MDFIDWCDRVLDKLLEVTEASVTARMLGVEWITDLMPTLFGEVAESESAHLRSKADSTRDALSQLIICGLVEDKGRGYYKATSFGERVAGDKVALWAEICDATLKPDQEFVLRAVNRLSPQRDYDRAWLENVEHDALLKELGWSSEDELELLSANLYELEQEGLVSLARLWIGTIEPESTYRGLVWQERRAITLDAKFIDELVANWETTSVEFKRELHTGTANQKAELFKDVIALANTQANGQRWLIVGFDDKTREYHAPPDAKITQEHLEQLMSVYTAPVVDVKYEVVNYKAGDVGRLEVLRDPKKLPYHVAKSVGGRKSIDVGDVFVRHGSLVEQPTVDELAAIEDEGKRARAL